jgi:glutathione S-transferase
MYKLYWSPGSAAMAPHAMLEDIGAPYELIRVDTAKGEQRGADYLKLNPHARVPTLIYDAGRVMYEATAICLFMAERHPEAGFSRKR